MLKPNTYAEAVAEYLTSAGAAASSRRIYRISLTTWTWLASGYQPPGSADRRRFPPPKLALAALDTRDAARTLERAAAQWADIVDADTLNRELSVFLAAIGWWRAKGWLATDPPWDCNDVRRHRITPARCPTTRSLPSGNSRSSCGRNVVAHALRHLRPRPVDEPVPATDRSRGRHRAHVDDQWPYIGVL